MNDDTLREQLRRIVTRNGNSVRIPEILEAELDDLMQLIAARDEQRDAISERDEPSVHIFDKWLSIDMGAEIRFEPVGMWGQRVWQNGATYVCSGIKKNEDCESITDSNDYRFTQVGSGSVGKEYSDVFIKGKDIKRWFDEGAVGDLKNFSGWFTLKTNQQTGEK